MSSSTLSFVPRWLASHFHGGAEGISLARFEAALLFVDVSGFSSLASALTHAHGADGADQLSSILNDCFGRVVESVARHGGEVVRFAGDAVLACWPITQDHPPSTAAALSAGCALSLAESVGQLPMNIWGRLYVRIGMGLGGVEAARVGGHDDHWEPLLIGPAVDQVCAAVRRAGAGEVLVSPEAWSQLVGAHGEPLEQCDLTRLRHIGPDIQLDELAARTPVARLRISPESACALERLYVSAFVADRIAAGLDGWVSELRTITTLFIHLGYPHEPAGDLETLHRVAGVIQAALKGHFGALKEVSVDDKGVVALGAFGMPFGGGPYHPRHGVECALELHHRLMEQGLAAGFGLATGKTFCGPVGTDARREYAIVGITVNLAARLAALGPGVRCDSATRESCGAQVVFSRPRSVPLKGFSEPVTFHLAESHGPARGERDSSAPGLAGRGALIAELVEMLSEPRGRTVILMGEPGIGKSRIITVLSEKARARGLSVVTAVGDPLALNSAWRAWRGAIEALLGIERVEGLSERTARVLAELERSHRLELAPLLNPILNLSLHDSWRTLGLRDFVRTDATQKLLVDLMRERAARGMLVVAEDWHWFDPASRAVFALVRRRFSTVHGLIASGAIEASVSVEHAQIVADSATRVIELGGLCADEVASLVRDRLGVSEAPRELCDWVHQRSRGNPLFTLELTAALKAARLVAVRDGRVSRAPSPDELEAFAPPPTIEGTVRYRVDGLSEPAQLTLKVASVLGLSFEPEELLAVHPMRDSAVVHRSLEELVDVQLCDRSQLGYSFRHRITRDVAYNGMLLAQRAQTHRAAALFYERASPEALRPRFALLAYHWAQTEETHRAFGYLEGAWEDASLAGAFAQAYQFMSLAVELDDRQRHAAKGVSALRRAKWLRAMADAGLAMGEPARIYAHSSEALGLLGEARPASRPEARRALIREVLTHLRSRLWPASPRFALSERDREAALAWSCLAESLSYVASDPIGVLTSALRAMNLAERGSEPIAVTAAYGQLASMAGAIGIDRLARRYLAEARRNAAACGSPREKSGALLTQLAVHSAHARWQEAHRGIDRELLPMLIERKNSHIAGTFLSFLAANAHYMADYGRAERRIRELCALAEAMNSDLLRGWGHCQSAVVAMVRGDFGAAEALAVRARGLLTAVYDSARTVALGVLAVCSLRLGRADQAREIAVELVEALMAFPTQRYTGLEAHGCASAVLLELSRVAGGSERETLLASAERSVALLERFAARFAVGRPRALTLRAELLCSRGHTLWSGQLFKRAASEARAREMPYEEALALAHWGRSVPGLKGKGRLTEAAMRFNALGCVWDHRNAAAIARTK